jgi:hypothetical protein
MEEFQEEFLINMQKILMEAIKGGISKKEALIQMQPHFIEFIEKIASEVQKKKLIPDDQLYDDLFGEKGCFIELKNYDNDLFNDLENKFLTVTNIKKKPMPKYSSKKFKELYETFTKLFTEEGNVYESTKQSVLEDYKHNLIPDDISKTVILTILKDAAVDYLKDEIVILNENKYLNQFYEEQI